LFTLLKKSSICDFADKSDNGLNIVLEIKGREEEKDRAKYEAAKRWCKAVTRWGKMDSWEFTVCKQPQEVNHLIDGLVIT